MTRKDAYAKLRDLVLRQAKELNALLVDLQPEVDPETFGLLRGFCDDALAETLLSVVDPIVAEFPELKPEKLA